MDTDTIIAELILLANAVDTGERNAYGCALAFSMELDEMLTSGFSADNASDIEAGSLLADELAQVASERFPF